MKLTNSKRLAAMLLEMGITSPFDVVNHIPYRYDDYRLSEELPLFHGKRLVLFGLASSAPTFTKAQRYQIVSFNFKSASGRSYKVVAFNRPYLRSLVKLGESYTLIGNYDQKKYALSLVTLRKGQIAPEDVIRPIYRLPSGIEQHVFHGLVQRVFEQGAKHITDIVPVFLRDKYKLLPKQEALRKLHFPLGFDDVYAGLRVYKYEEALKFSLKTQLIRRQNTLLRKNVKPQLNLDKITGFITSLPFKLSADQTAATNDIIADMKLVG
jgi:ATP-dependent DNA helicase RecG